MSTANATRQAVDSMIGDIAKNHKPKVNLLGLEQMQNKGGYVRVTASVTDTMKGNTDSKFIIDALLEKLNNKLRPVAQSFHILASNDIGKTITGILTTNPVSVAYEEDMAGFKSLSGNMFMDEEEHLWALRKSESGDILVKSMGSEDADIIADLIPMVSSAGLGTLGYEAVASADRENSVRSALQGGDFVSFVNPDNESVEFGVIVASVSLDNGEETDKIIVQSSAENSDVATIDRSMVMSRVDGVDTGDLEVSESSGAKSLSEISAYYKQMFIRDPSYFEKFMSRWTSHVFA